MREFVSKTKKIKVTVDGVSYEMKSPTLGQSEKLDQDVKSASPSEVINVYKKFFVELGLSQEVYSKMDYEDFLEFIGFILNPKAKGPQNSP